MAQFDATQTFPRPIAEVFDFFRRPANLVRVTPPELHMQLVEGPELAELGSRIVLAGRRWGVPQRVASAITVFVLNDHFVDEQREGPFKQWRHTHRFEEIPEGTRVRDHIEYQPPGGLLGLLVCEAFVERDLKWIFEYRSQTLKQLLG
jgi:ligand-binding SRPBCC domain-containing protein